MDLSNTLFVVGATGVGKSEMAADFARRVGAEIIGADAFQIYQGLDLLTAKPSPELLARVPHHLIGEVPLTSSFDVAQYLEAAKQRSAGIRARGSRILVVGGTGLYVRALTHGLAQLPAANPKLRAELQEQPLAELQACLRKLDPVAATTLDFHNPRRLVRAIEVCVLTGKPFSRFREEWRRTPPDLRGVVLSRSRDDLEARLARRTEEMFASGVVEEVAAAGEIQGTAAQVIGLAEIRSFLLGKLPREQCIEQIKTATRQYAKRQRTWFRREPAFVPVDLSAGASIETLLDVAGW